MEAEEKLGDGYGLLLWPGPWEAEDSAKLHVLPDAIQDRMEPVAKKGKRVQRLSATFDMVERGIENSK